MSKVIKDNVYSNPKGISLDFDVDDIKIPGDAIDNRSDIIKKGIEKFSDYGKPNLDLTTEELKEKYKEKENNDLKQIDKAFAENKIDEKTRDFLYDYFKDSWQKHDDFKKQLNVALGGAPKSIKYINFYDGKIDEETPYFDEHVRPDTTMVYEYEINAPWRPENELPDSKGEKITIRVLKPMMKDVMRTIEKVKIGGKYDLECKKELAKLKPGQTIEEAGLDKRKLRLPYERMRDILRCTILAPRYDDVQAIHDRLIENNLALNSSRPSKYLDNDVKNAEEFFKNSKNYRDNKLYLYVPTSDNKTLLAEVQGKIETQYFKADILSHFFYEDAREFQEKFHEAETEGDKLLLNRKIYNKMLDIQNVNTQAFTYCNLEVFRDMKFAEERAKASGVKPNEDGTYPVSKKIAEKCLLVRSSIALMPNSFDKYPAWCRDICKRYKDIIAEKYLVKLGPKDLHREWCHEGKNRGR